MQSPQDTVFGRRWNYKPQYIIIVRHSYLHQGKSPYMLLVSRKLYTLRYIELQVIMLTYFQFHILHKIIFWGKSSDPNKVFRMQKVN